jgi:DNA-binding transcriptional LysR family regulator
VFLIAARCGTFSRAAKEMFVTQSAVSRRIQQLEDDLGLSLFVRHKLGLRLTPEGEALLPVIEDAFGRVTRICVSLRNAGQVLTLRMPPTLATRWFLPLLPSLRVVMPDVDVRVTTYDAWEPRFEDNSVDAAIIQGRGEWPDVEAIALIPELLTPVCSADLADQLASPADLATIPLLHCDPIQAWARWLEAAGVGQIESHRGQTFDTLELALSAAARGQGVALGDLNLIRESLTDGILVAPFDMVLNQGISYFLIYPSQRAQLPKIRALRDWLTAEASRSRVQV